MKIVEPISSALLITGCVYSAGTSQNSAFMREFGINPEFSQPPVDKILYDGGLITFEVFYGHLIYVSLLALVVLVLLAVSWGVAGCMGRAPARLTVLDYVNKAKSALAYVPVGFLLLLYIVYLCFASYEKSQDVGVKLSEMFIERCHWVVLNSKDGTTKACAFRKDKDSIWYYNIKVGGLDVSSKLLTELGQVTYLEPQKMIAE